METSTNTDKLGGLDGGTYDDKGNSSHYQSQFMEYLRDQERKYGTIIAMMIAQSNVDKYNQRHGLKSDTPASKDTIKRDWYLKAANHFKKKIIAEKERTTVVKKNKYIPLAEEVIDLLRAEFSLPGELYVPLSVAIEQ